VSGTSEDDRGAVHGAPSFAAGGREAEGLSRRQASVIVAVAVALATVGFISGSRERAGVRPPPPRPAAPLPEGVPPARAYYELHERPIVANAGYESRLETLRFERPDRSAPVPTPTAEERAAAVAARALRRAYDGAPPVVPHAIAERTVESCLACHGEGLVVEGRVAPKLSHARYLSCTQCHVEAEGGAEFVTAALAERPEGMSEWTALARSGPGARAGPGAPPVIPHATRLRSDCTSCHGALAPPGIRTTHPERVSCTQCHAPSAALEQRDFPPPSRSAPGAAVEEGEL
jgi:cytochrome c-type protein NapB